METVSLEINEIKKRGRKPKNYYVTNETVTEKKKRGRKKKYEIENINKLLNRNQLNNFNHNIVYDEETIKSDDNESEIKSVSFGNLNITVSKKEQPDDKGFRNKLIEKTKQVINEDEYSSEEEHEIPIENVIGNNFEKYYRDKDFSMYQPEIKESKDTTFKKLRVITCLKTVIKDSQFPETTDISCWWCCHTFKTCPCTLPVEYDAYTKKFKCIGIFCSWGCVKAYNYDLKDRKVDERNSFISLIIKQMYSICTAVSIKSSPPRQTLKMFGGYMTIDEFRDNKVFAFRLNLINNIFIYPEVTEINNIKRKTPTVKKQLRLARNPV
jgi:hypothetical protein